MTNTEVIMTTKSLCSCIEVFYTYNLLVGYGELYKP